jgi:hypothetical protein
VHCTGVEFKRRKQFPAEAGGFDPRPESGTSSAAYFLMLWGVGALVAAQHQCPTVGFSTYFLAAIALSSFGIKIHVGEM